MNKRFVVKCSLYFKTKPIKTDYDWSILKRFLIGYNNYVRVVNSCTAQVSTTKKSSKNSADFVCIFVHVTEMSIGSNT